MNTNMTASQLRERLDLLKKNKASPAWLLIEQIMRDEIVQAAFRIAEARPISVEDIHFQRGALWASRRLVDIHDALIARYETDLALATAAEESRQGRTEKVNGT